MSEQDDDNPAPIEQPEDDDPRRRNTGDIKPPTRLDPPEDPPATPGEG
jgi:hypothetical protein